MLAAQVAAKRQSKTRLNEAPLLAEQRKPAHCTVRAARGQTAVERLQQRAARAPAGRSSSGNKAPKRDAAEALLDELTGGDGQP